MCMYVIVWHKGSLTASNSLSSGSCCGAGAWWPIPPAPYFSFNDAQINSSTLFQNSSSQLILRPLDILTSTPPFHPDTKLSIVTHLLPLHLFYSSPTFFDFPCASLFLLIDFLILFSLLCPALSVSRSASRQFKGLHHLLTGHQLNFTFLLSPIQQKSNPRLCKRYLFMGECDMLVHLC